MAADGHGTVDATGSGIDEKRRTVAICVTVLLLCAVALPDRAAAASGQPVPTVAINLIVELVAPDVLKVGLMYTCQPEPTALGNVTVSVSQAVPLPAQGTGGADLTCDGASHDVEVMVFGGPMFAAGPAQATAQACTTLTCGTDARKVTITEGPSPLAPLAPLGVPPLGVPPLGVPALGVPALGVPLR